MTFGQSYPTEEERTFTGAWTKNRIRRMDGNHLANAESRCRKTLEEWEWIFKLEGRLKALAHVGQM